MTLHIICGIWVKSFFMVLNPTLQSLKTPPPDPLPQEGEGKLVKSYYFFHFSGLIYTTFLPSTPFPLGRACLPCRQGSKGGVFPSFLGLALPFGGNTGGWVLSLQIMAYLGKSIDRGFYYQYSVKKSCS